MAKEATPATLPPEVISFISGAQLRFKDEPRAREFCGRDCHSNEWRTCTKALRFSSGLPRISIRQDFCSSLLRIRE